MRNGGGFVGGRHRAGARSLMVVGALAVVLGVVGMHYHTGQRANLLYFFFVPVAAVSVVLGKKMGVLLALFSVVACLVPTFFGGLSHLVPVAGNPTAQVVTVASWALFLVAMAWLVGWVSERGGSLTLVRGIGSRALKAIEQTQRRTGQDIHDGIAQYAAAAYMEMEILSSLNRAADPEVAGQTERVRRLVEALATEARSMVGNLRPPPLGPTEFVGTLTQHVEAFRERTGIACQLELEGDFSVHSDSMRICIYRITQEALTNVERHSEATLVRVWTRASRGGVDLLIRDNGNGLAPPSTPDGDGHPPYLNGHYGLQGMRDRVGYLGGRLMIRSKPGEGTSLAIYVPAYRGD